MFEDNNLGMMLFKNPLLVQKHVLEEQEKRLSQSRGTDINIGDPNNSFIFLLESCTDMTSEAIRSVENTLSELYPKRSTNTKELYKHLSDFDIVNLMSSPAEIPEVTLILDRDYLIENAVDYNEVYKKVVIPRDTIFYIGKFEFGIYYPIEIQINKRTNSINVVYDTTEDNPLYKLSHNIVKSNTYNYSGLNLINLTFPIYQFSKRTIYEDIISTHGFSKTHNYTDRFYSARVFDETNGNELKVAMANSIYDTREPTIQISIIPEDNKIQFTIPQVYLTIGSIGKKIRIELYTTKGALDVDISEISNENMQANFAFDKKTTTKYSSILNNISTIIIQPQSNRILGGHNGYSYEELREQIVNNSFYNSIPVTELELVNYGNKNGFVIKKHQDNITDRVLYAYKKVLDNDGHAIPITNSEIRLTKDVIDNTSSIIESSDKSITILPTTIFEYTNNGVCIPLKDEVKSSLNNLSKANFADKINDSTYTRSPFHIRLITDSRYPRSESYNLINPYCDSLIFEEDNLSTNLQMMAVAYHLEHKNDGSGGYLLRLGMQKNDDFKNLAEEDIVVYITTVSKNGTTVGKLGEYQGEVGDLSIYDFNIETNYHISPEHELGITNMVTKDNLQMDQHIDLEATMNIIVTVNGDVLSDSVYNNDRITVGINTEYSEARNYIGIIRQRINCIFGEQIDTTFNTTNVNTTNQGYLRYTEDEYHRYTTDVYETNADGTLHIVGQENGNIILNKLHSAGDIIYEDDNPLIKHSVGDIVLDVTGSPITATDRDVIYDISSMQLDLKLFHASDPIYKNFSTDIVTQLNSYLANIEKMRDEILFERTSLYFKPIKTIGKTRFGVGDNKVLSMDLSLSFGIKLYVFDFVYNDSTIISNIEETIISVIENTLKKDIISMTEISETLSRDLDGYIESIDIGGINNDKSLQTLFVKDSSTKPIIKNKLVNRNNQLFLEKDVDIKILKAT